MFRKTAKMIAITHDASRRSRAGLVRPSPEVIMVFPSLLLEWFPLVSILMQPSILSLSSVAVRRRADAECRS
ncbi:hypothetical protein [Burkholderia cenocepacia]|uniref:hypothetical protein n=1 Tax=Burkholderia cenocepacia TaxID=95486 RepID=UPI001BA8CFF2|nr:hypothetical protein [Burkholderia cenocepacia]